MISTCEAGDIKLILTFIPEMKGRKERAVSHIELVRIQEADNRTSGHTDENIHRRTVFRIIRI